MIVVTLGTHEQPMMRLVPVLAALARELPSLGPFQIQRGATPLPEGWEGDALVAPQRLAALLAAADIVVMHGGPATIAEARELGKIPIVVPRQLRYREHVDDHQLWYARRLADALEIVLVEEAEDLPAAVEDYPARVARLPVPRPHDPAPAVRRFSEIADRLMRPD